MDAPRAGCRFDIKAPPQTPHGQTSPHIRARPPINANRNYRNTVNINTIVIKR